MVESAYQFGEMNKKTNEGQRLSEQARLFAELELPELMSHIPPTAKVADFGCGTGVISTVLAQNLPHSHVIGLEPDPKALEIARQAGRGIPNLGFAPFDLNQAGKPEGAPYDVAFTRLVLMHLRDPAAAVMRMASFLKPGGLLYLVDTDDRCAAFLPVEEWQKPFMEGLESAQRLKGGTRQLGSSLVSLLAAAGVWPEGNKTIYCSTEDIGLERFKDIFMPVARYYLGFLKDQKKLEEEIAQGLLNSASAFFDKPGNGAKIASCHVWGHKR